MPDDTLPMLQIHNPADREAIVEALQRIPFRERAGVTKAAPEAAMEALPESEAEQIQAMIKALAGSVNKMGGLLALEISPKALTTCGRSGDAVV